MTRKFNPLASKGLDYFLHQGIASYKFTGWKELAEMTDPGAGNFYLNYGFGGIGDMYAVVSLMDSHGYWMTWNWMTVESGLTYYDIFLSMFGKTNSDQYITAIIIPDEEWVEITAGEGEDEALVALAIPIWFILFPLLEDGDDMVVDEFPENDEVLFSVDFSWNQDYLGSMAWQDYDNVSIIGGVISDPVAIYRPEGTPDADPGWASCSTVNMTPPLGYLTLSTEDGVEVVVPYWTRAGV